MSKLVETINKLDGLLTLNGVSQQVIESAENILGLTFALDYKEYLSTYGCITFNGHEFTGLGVSKRLNVCDVTAFEQCLKPTILSDKYIIEVLLDGEKLIAQNKDGTVFDIQSDGEISNKYECIYDYLNSIV
jgi:hypothetical protein